MRTAVRGVLSLALVAVCLACGSSDPTQDPATGTTSTGPGSTDESSTTRAESSGATETGQAQTGATESSGGSTTTGANACEVVLEPNRCDQPGYTGPGDCDPYQQTGCPPGEKCLPYDPDGQGVWDSTRCGPVAAEPAGLGEPCTMLAGPSSGGEDTCDTGLICWDLVGDQGTCAPMCGCGDASPTCSAASNACAVLNGGAVGVCRPTCVPTDLDACGPNQVCAITSSAVFQCLNAGGNAGEGQACNALNACAPGLICGGDSLCGGAGPCCVAFCDIEDPATCDATCQQFFMPGAAPHECYDTLGVCASR